MNFFGAGNSVSEHEKRAVEVALAKDRTSSFRQRETETLQRRLFEWRTKSNLKARHNTIPRIIVDLTPLLPGGENGGAKPMALELIRRMAVRAPKTRFILLTLQRTFDELTTFKQGNIQVVVVRDEEMSTVPPARRLDRFLGRFWLKPSDRESLVRRLGGSVLFCPFTAPFFARPGTPTVSVIHDLQYADYPQYFEEHNRAQRHQNFIAACRHADQLLCVSDFVRRRVLEESGLPHARVTTVHTQLAHRFSVPAPEGPASLLAKLELTPGRYFLYPANFWQHKNHEMLFLAMRLLAARWPRGDTKLVCTGAPGERRNFLQSAVVRMRLGDRVIFPGYLSEPDFAGLMHGCLALIYPSLYEGFGMPVLEAQAMGKPVLCSNIETLAEVAGASALTFNPKLPEKIVAAMRRIESDMTLREDLVRNGFENAKRFSDADAMANRYLRTLADVTHGAPSVPCQMGHV